MDDFIAFSFLDPGRFEERNAINIQTPLCWHTGGQAQNALEPKCFRKEQTNACGFVDAAERDLIKFNCSSGDT